MKPCICIPTYRKDIASLRHLEFPALQIFIVSDPDTFEYHAEIFKTNPQIRVERGAKGMSAQVAECYRVAHREGFKWWFKLDDDLGPRSFLHKDGRYLKLDETMDELWKCVKETETTHAGLNNSMNRFWMHDGYGRTYGQIHGAFNISCAASDPERFIDTRINYYEDVYRSLSHRKLSGAVGRVKHIGVNKKGSTERVVEAKTKHQADIDLILQTFPDMITCTGTKEINGGQDIIANWRYKKGNSPVKDRRKNAR